MLSLETIELLKSEVLNKEHELNKAKETLNIYINQYVKEHAKFKRGDGCLLIDNNTKEIKNDKAIFKIIEPKITKQGNIEYECLFIRNGLIVTIKEENLIKK